MSRTSSYLVIWFLAPLVIMLGLLAFFGGHGFIFVAASLAGLSISGTALSAFLIHIKKNDVLRRPISIMIGAVAGLCACILMWIALRGWRYPVDLAYINSMLVITTVLVLVGSAIGWIAATLSNKQPQ